jgi:imidazoleglycerol phosphate synthase glutamine amidotransferase subunit HisH
VIVNKTPILGICLGAQSMGNMSEEGEIPNIEAENSRQSPVVSRQLVYSKNLDSRY